MIKLTDIVYYGNGFVATFDDNSVANTQFKVVDGKLITIGLNPEQKAAVDVFNDTSIDTGTSDLLGQGSTAAIRSMIEGIVTTEPEPEPEPGEAFANTYAFSCDGINDSGITGAVLTGIPGAGGYSVSCWIKNADWSTTPSEYGEVWALMYGNTDRSKMVWPHNNSRKAQSTEAGGVSSSNYSTAYNGIWIHLCLASTSTSSAGGTRDVFVNGVSATNFPTTSGQGALSGVDTFKICNSGWPWLEGLIDEVAIYDTALSPGEVGNIYASGKSVDLKSLTLSEPYLKHWWRFGDGDGDATQNGTIYDQVGSADMTMSGFADAFGRVEDGPPIS